MSGQVTGGGDIHPKHLARKLGLTDAVFVGLGAMIGAGIFSAIAPAADATGSWLLVALAIAALVAFCNALSSAQLAALYPAAGGTYVYGRERLGHFWGFLAGWGFVIGKVASCAAMALTFGFYVNEDFARVLAVGAVLTFTAVNVLGIEKTATLAMVLVIIVIATLSIPVLLDVWRFETSSSATPFQTAHHRTEPRTARGSRAAVLCVRRLCAHRHAR